MISDRAEKTSLAGSVLVHAVVVLAVLVLGSALPEGKGKVLWVDVLEGTPGSLAGEKTGESAGPETRDVPAATGRKAKVPAKPEEDEVVKEERAAVPEPLRREINERAVEVEPAPAVESISFEARAFHREGPSLEVSGLLRKEPRVAARREGSAGPSAQGAGKANVSRDVPVQAYLASTGGPPALRQGGAGGGLSQSDRRALISRIQASIQDALMYPPLARRRGMEGTVEAVFVIDSRGMPQNIRLLRSSGYRILDKQALRTIQRASPYPVLESAVEVPITFRLTKD
jgi:protein TonB